MHRMIALKAILFWILVCNCSKSRQ